MDPVTQGVFGAVFSQSRSTRASLAKAGAIGAIAGMAPDLDILIRSSSDPLFALEFHRHFSHSLIFIPFGALACFVVLYPLLGRRWSLSPLQVYLWCLIGYATHGLLDGCTSYGTQLLWPFINTRFSWDIISIIDPLVTLPLILMSIFAARWRKPSLIYAAITWIACYFAFGYVQHERAIKIGQGIATQRNHSYSAIEAKPSFGNLIVWKTIYTTETEYYVDAVRPGLFSNLIWEGEHIQKLEIERDLPWLDRDSQQAKDIERFRWFSNGYLALDPEDRYSVIDMRYSLLPNSISPLWGITLSPVAGLEEHVKFETDHERPKEALTTLLSMIFSQNN